MKWEKPADETKKSYRWRCSNCGKICYHVPKGPRQNENACSYRFCPWCGERMDGDGRQRNGDVRCKWLSDDFGEICIKADCPACADFCPCVKYPDLCRHSEGWRLED